MKRENFIKIVSFAIALFAGTTLYAQGVRDLRFNEVLARNTEGLQNEMGHKCGWIEFRNSGYSSAELGGCQIVVVNNSGERITCAVPRGVSGTIIPPQGYLVMFLDPSSDSPMTTNFTLDDAKYLLLYDASGKGQHLDSIVINQSMIRENVALSRAPINMKTKSSRGVDSNTSTRVAQLEEVSAPTPGYANYALPKESRAEAFRRMDSSGIAMTIIAMSVVFMALLMLFLVFREVGRLLQKMAKNKEAKKNPVAVPVAGAPVAAEVEDLNGEQLAAIAFAIRMYDDEMNQVESNILTINRTTKAYSPWSSKIHGLTRIPEVTKNR